MVRADIFLPAIRRGIDGPLEMMMREALLSAAIRFCRESLVSRETLQFGAAQAGLTLSLAPADTALIFSRLLSVTSRQSPNIAVALWPGVDFTVEADQLRLLCPVAALRVRMATEPAPGATELPDALEAYQEALAAGALMQLYMMAGKPWSDAQRADYYRLRFVDGYREAFRSSSEVAPYETGFHNPTRRHAFF
ncbi:hypothetical protein [Edwardsiella ictaluri]|nr:hypothetical protein [Edwardsiella ictaluri]ELV7528814.1 hypothetical protein [Edwardsiella ictaluri]KMQ77907.1 hypothetical protein ABY58_12090 [Edwardsiella ictaluri]KOO54769.1 hypothetical protein ACS33_11950 [Edwardsiella ictaluri]QPW30152.1 hypothetical protein F8539_09290 [Edwardsiella ictaluri]WJH21179.1 hypothetical protein FGU63_09305 [Edwardsiella ictaluri]